MREFSTCTASAVGIVDAIVFSTYLSSADSHLRAYLGVKPFTKASSPRRFLAIDGVNKANSGHPGCPMGCAPMTYVLYNETMKHNPANPKWSNRDRFVLSAGHGSMLQYSIMHLTGYKSVSVSSRILRLPLPIAPSRLPGYASLVAPERPGSPRPQSSKTRFPSFRSD